MKTEVQRLKTPEVFTPFTITVTFETVEEARALRAIGGGMTCQAMTDIHDGAIWKEGVSTSLMERVLGSISESVERELLNQGMRGMESN